MADLMPLQAFLPVMAFLAAATQREPSPETIRVYHRMLGDIPLATLQAACERAIATHKFATLPTVGQIRELSAQMSGQQCNLSAMEGLEQARRAINQAGGGYASSDDRNSAYAKLGPLVARVVQAFGWDAICNCDNRETLQAQWRRHFEEVVSRCNLEAVQPARLRIGVSDGQGRIGVDVSSFGRLPMSKQT